MSVVYTQNSSDALDTATMFLNDNGVIKTENDLDIFINNNGNIYKMPQKENMILNLDQFSFKSNSCLGKNFCLTNDFTLKVKNTTKSVFSDSQNNTGSLGNYTTATDEGCLYIPKAQNQHNITLSESLFQNSQIATISLTFKTNSQNNNSGFFFLLDTLNVGLGTAWSPWRVTIRQNSTNLATSGTSLTEGSFNNATLVFDNGTITLFVNGSQSVSASGQGAWNACNRIWLNGYTSHTGTFANFGMKSFRVWKDVALTEQEVSDMCKFDFF